MSLLHLLQSSGSLANIQLQSSVSLANMANAMLEDELKSSQPDLAIWSSAAASEEADKRYGEEKTDTTVLKKRRDPRSVVIQVPPKRRKLDPALTARRLVHGECNQASCSFQVNHFVSCLGAVVFSHSLFF